MFLKTANHCGDGIYTRFQPHPLAPAAITQWIEAVYFSLYSASKGASSNLVGGNFFFLFLFFSPSLSFFLVLIVFFFNFQLILIELDNLIFKLLKTKVT